MRHGMSLANDAVSDAVANGTAHVFLLKFGTILLVATAFFLAALRWRFYRGVDDGVVAIGCNAAARRKFDGADFCMLYPNFGVPEPSFEGKMR